MIKALLLLSFITAISGVMTANAGNCSVTHFTDTLPVQYYDPYLHEPMPANAPEWMKKIVDSPSGVNYNEMQTLFNAWKASDVNVRVKTLDNKPAVNFFRRWSSAYREFVHTDGTIQLPTILEYQARVDAMNERVSKVNASNRWKKACLAQYWSQ